MEEQEAQAARGALESATAAALRTIDEVRGLLEAATSDDLAERAATVREKLEASREALERATREKDGPSIEALARAERSIKEDLEEVEEWTRQNPLRALLAAAGVGLLLGLLSSRRR
jgi:ElaB/YqjD/DUF883 family membrane-anchored ribosome-binding protein